MMISDQHGNELTAPNDIRTRKGSAMALAGGAVLMATGLSLHLKNIEEEGHLIETVGRVAAAPEVWMIGHVLTGVGGILFILGLIAVPALAQGRGRRVVAVGAALTAVGAASMALGDFAHGSLAYVLIGEVSDQQSLQVQQQYFDAPLLLAVGTQGLLLPLGMLVLGGGLLYSRAVPMTAALLVLVAPVAIQLGLTTALPMPVMVLPMFVGMVWLSLILTRKPG